MISRELQEEFSRLLYEHIHKLTIRGARATGLCPLHVDHRPSLVADLERCIWYCFPCGRGGGVRDFALALGEEWSHSHSKSRGANAQRARFQAERHARTILERRAEARDLMLCAAHRALYGEALAASDLLGLFHKRTDLAEEFSTLVAKTEKEYGEALFTLSILEARLDGELV